MGECKIRFTFRQYIKCFEVQIAYYVKIFDIVLTSENIHNFCVTPLTLIDHVNNLYKLLISSKLSPILMKCISPKLGSL